MQVIKVATAHCVNALKLTIPKLPAKQTDRGRQVRATRNCCARLKTLQKQLSSNFVCVNALKLIIPKLPAKLIAAGKGDQKLPCTFENSAKTAFFQLRFVDNSLCSNYSRQKVKCAHETSQPKF